MEKDKNKEGGRLLYLPLYSDPVVEYSLIEKYILFPRELPTERTHQHLLTDHGADDRLLPVYAGIKTEKIYWLEGPALVT